MNRKVSIGVNTLVACDAGKSWQRVLTFSHDVIVPYESCYCADMCEM